ncbi:PVC-type heme-binding CxxCH protein [Spirosoma arcticum]
MNVSLKKLSIVLIIGGILGCTTSLQQASRVTGSDAQYSGGDFDEHIRKSEPCSPEEEQAGFVLQPGFKIELFASEPLIGKPLNMSFDAKGRLWVTQSAEYPAPAKTGAGADRITILEDTDHDGKADKFTPVLDSLNIPIGLLPLTDGLLTYSIPNLYRFRDTNGDGQLDSSRRLLGPFEHKDTHGMVNHLTRGFDGWIQACHGFTNFSKVMGADGDTVKLESGSTFRFRTDGSRAELTTKGRVNPFGLVYDNWGYLYSPDSHTSPLTQLIRGAEYPHFGRISEGMDFAPAMKSHEMEATALSGIALPSSNLFPESYRNSLYIGDVVKCRIYRNSFTFNGSSPTATHEADLLQSPDPWFRPVDMLEGPDGALYVADFYNRVIGHYEVPLDNPGRDRQRGRIWRITYQGKTDRIGYTDWTKATTDELIRALAVGNLPVRMLVTDQLVNRVGQAAVAPLKKALEQSRTKPNQYVHCFWALHQLDALPEATLLNAMQHKNPLIRTHALRALHESPVRNETRYAALKRALGDANAHVQRAAVENFPDYPTLETVRTLLAYQPGIPTPDTHLTYTLSLALRTLLRNKPLGNEVSVTTWTPAECVLLSTPMSGVKEAYAGQFLYSSAKTLTLSKEDELKFLGHAAQFLPPTERDALVAFVRQKYDTDQSSQFILFRLIQESMKKQGAPMNGAIKQWALVLANQLVALQPSDWSYTLTKPVYLKDHPVLFGAPPQNSKLAKTTKFIGYEQGGYKGVIRSPLFTAPKSLSFIATNLNGATSIGGGHWVRLISATDTTRVLICTEFVKTNEYKVEPVTWDLSAHAGEPVRLEIADNSSGVIRVGIFGGLLTPLLPAISPKEHAEQKRFGMELAGEFGITTLEPMLKATLLDKAQPLYFRLASAKALMKLAPDRYAAILGAYIEDETNPPCFRTDLATTLGDSPSRGQGLSQTQVVLESTLKRTKGDVQLELLKSLAASSFGKELIMAQVQAGTLYTRILVQPGIEERLLLNMSDKQKEKFKQLTANLSPIDDEREQLIVSRLNAFTATPALAESGRQVFAANCAACHQIARIGGLIGPQLDGIGSWGSKSLATKILDPNRNISEAFRLYTIKLKSGSVKMGLFRRDDAQSITYADAAGAEFVVPRNDIAELQASRHTLMPDQFGKVLPEKEFSDLLAYLLSVK